MKLGMQDKLSYKKLLAGLNMLKEKISNSTVEEMLSEELVAAEMPRKRGAADKGDNGTQEERKQKKVRRVRKCSVCKKPGHVARQGVCRENNERVN